MRSCSNRFAGINSFLRKSNGIKYFLNNHFFDCFDRGRGSSAFLIRVVYISVSQTVVLRGPRVYLRESANSRLNVFK